VDELNRLYFANKNSLSWAGHKLAGQQTAINLQGTTREFYRVRVRRLLIRQQLTRHKRPSHRLSSASFPHPHFQVIRPHDLNTCICPLGKAMLELRADDFKGTVSRRHKGNTVRITHTGDEPGIAPLLPGWLTTFRRRESVVGIC